MKKKIKEFPWAIFYEDGTEYHSYMGPPECAPALGFVCAIGYDEDGSRYIMHGYDHYRWDEDTNQWWGMDLVGLLDTLCRNKVKAYKMGRTVSKARFNKIMFKAHSHEDYPQNKFL
jgi:hypothetical protein